MLIALIAAMAKGRVIGKDSTMPWHLPADLKHFKKITLGKPIIMGRKTFESIGKPLPDRDNIVLTRNANFQADGVTVFADIEAALAHCRDQPEVMIIGGGHLYEQLLPRANRLYLTFIDTDIEGDTYFPEWDPKDFQEVTREPHAADDHNPHNYTFVTLERA